jgi:FtsZ-binding cell division protein ZapB
MKRSLCPHCRKRLEEGQRIHPGCIDGYATAQAAKLEREEWKRSREAIRAEKADLRQRKEALKRIPDYIKEAQIAFNAWIRARDANRPCICCGRTQEMGYGTSSHGWDCGHYRSTGSASHLRFNEDNAHRQLVLCNRWGAGRAVDYRIGLINRIGLERVEALEANNVPKKWTREELKEITQTYRRKLKELQQ